MARQHGYFVLIPAFIPVDKKSLQNQIQTGTVIHEAAQTQDLAAMMALPGIRYHASKTRDGAPKELHSRWGSVEVEAAGGEPAAAEEDAQTDVESYIAGQGSEAPADEPTPDVEPVQDEATTTGRRSRAKAA